MWIKIHIPGFGFLAGMDLFLSSFLLGIAFCAPPGIVTVEAIRRGIARGFWATLLVEFGSLIGDAVWAIIALLGIAFVFQKGPLPIILTGLGSIFLFYLSWSAIRDARQGKMPAPGNDYKRGDFSSGAMLSLGNPFTLAFWLGIGSSAIISNGPNPGWYHFGLFLGAFMLGALVWCFILAGLVLWGRKYINPVFFRLVNLICGLFLGYYGVRLIWNILASS